MGGASSVSRNARHTKVESRKTSLYEEHQELLDSEGAHYASLRASGFRSGDCLLIVGMQNDFLRVAGKPEGESAAAVIVELANQAAASQALIVATRDHSSSYSLTHNGPTLPHCVQGSWGGELIAPIEQVLKEVQGSGADVRVIDENLDALPDVQSVWFPQTLADVLEDAGVNRLFVCGLAMDVRVLDLSLKAATTGLAPQGTYLIVDAARAVHVPGAGPFGSGFTTDPMDIVKKTDSAGVKLIRSYAIGRPLMKVPLAQDVPRLLGQENQLCRGKSLWCK